MISETVLSMISFSRRKLYRGPVRQIAYESGIEPILADGYAKVKGWLASRSSKTFRIEDEEFTFHDSGVFGAYLGEKKIILDLLGRLQTDDVFYDVGAAFGLYTCPAARFIQDGRVIAFEPSGRVSQLRKNLAVNGLEADIEQCALSNEAGEMYLNAENHLVKEQLDDAFPQVDLIPGDILVDRRGYPYPDVMKIDVEGAEWNVIQGLENSLSECRLIYCEVHPHLLPDGVTANDVETLLHNLGFKITPIGEHGNIYTVRAER